MRRVRRGWGGRRQILLYSELLGRSHPSGGSPHDAKGAGKSSSYLARYKRALAIRVLGRLVTQGSGEELAHPTKLPSELVTSTAQKIRMDKDPGFRTLS